MSTMSLAVSSIRADIAALVPTTRRLLLSRLLRSICQGALVVDFALYLGRLHWKGESIGALLGASFVFGAILSLVVGPVSDRFGYRRVLIVYEAAMAMAFAAAALCVNGWILSAAAVLGAFGRGANGAPGCFVPVELAWLAEAVPPYRRASVFSVNTAVGFVGMTAGALLAAGPYLWGRWLPGDAAYQPLFWLGGAIALVNVILLVGATDAATGRPTPSAARPPVSRLSAAERRALAKLAIINLFNGLSVGLSGPLIAYWFATKFLVGPQQLGPVVAIAFLLTALFAVAVAQLSTRSGGVRTYVRLQWAALILLLVLPLAADFGCAAAIWIVKFTFERSAAGTMEAVSVGLVSPQRRGLASGLAVATLALPRALGPVLAGHWISTGVFATPLVLAACVQVIYISCYHRAYAGPAGRGRDGQGPASTPLTKSSK